MRRRRIAPALRLAAALSAAAAGAAAEPVTQLVEDKAREDFGARFPDRGEIRVALTHAPVEDAMLLSAFWIDEETGQFIANALTETGETHRLTGYAVVRVPVAVPVRQMMPGEIVQEADLQIVDLPQGRLGSFTVPDAEKLVGMEVRSLLAKGRPVMAQAIQEPLVISRGQAVTIRYDDGRLALTAPGRALRDAHAGQEVKVVNVVSNQTVIGRAAADGTIEVTR
ncbi:flagellar basal body P-ring formation chaperone FlgA [Roseivivax sp. CAU 1761]